MAASAAIFLMKKKLLENFTMAKVLFKPNGNFMLLLQQGELKPHRPTLFRMDPYLQSMVSAGKLVVVADGLSDEATDADFEGFWKESDCNEELAVESFVSKFKEPSEEEKAAAEKKAAEEAAAAAKKKAEEEKAAAEKKAAEEAAAAAKKAAEEAAAEAKKKAEEEKAAAKKAAADAAK